MLRKIFALAKKLEFGLTRSTTQLTQKLAESLFPTARVI